jgi:SAM-dependent methyltransferase
LDLAHLEALRIAELEDVLGLLGAGAPPGASLLEIGAGTGWQARRLAESGYAVQAVDVAGSGYAARRVWPVTIYDGSRLPFADASFDLLFSSNVLEHVAGLEAFQREMQRVLRPGGRAIHLVPSAAWRFWETATHYPFLAATLARCLRRDGATPAAAGERARLQERLGRLSKTALIRKALVPARHGATGSAAGELVAFSRRRWRRGFERGGWVVVRERAGGLFYTGHMLLGPALSLRARRALSRVAGSACHVFVLEKAR